MAQNESIYDFLHRLGDLRPREESGRLFVQGERRGICDISHASVDDDLVSGRYVFLLQEEELDARVGLEEVEEVELEGVELGDVHVVLVGRVRDALVHHADGALLDAVAGSAAGT